MPNRRMKALTVGANTYDLVDETSGYITGMTILSYGSSSWQDFLAAYNAQKVVYCRASSQSNPASGSQTRLAFMAYVNDATNPTSVEFQYYRSVSSKSVDQQGDQVFIYTLTSAGNWSVTTREAMAEIRAGGDLTESYSNGVLTISGTIPTVPTNVSAFTNDAGYLTSYTETDPTVPSWAKASTKPTYTASEVGAAATSHAHGNITSGGDITATAPTIANGDQIIINDHSASKITNGPTFDGSTTNKYLSPKGTWESLPQGTGMTDQEVEDAVAAAFLPAYAISVTGGVAYSDSALTQTVTEAWENDIIYIASNHAVTDSITSSPTVNFIRKREGWDVYSFSMPDSAISITITGHAGGGSND